MHAIITVIGKDKVGIIAKVTTMLAEIDINVLEISQTIMSGNFTMVVLVDYTLCKLSFGEISAACNKLGDDMNLSIKIQRTEIFEAMHTI